MRHMLWDVAQHANVIRARRRRSAWRRMRDSNSRGVAPNTLPTMLASVHRHPPPSVTWADRNGWVLADAREPRRMRPHLRPARPASPLPAAWTSSCGSHGAGTHSLATGPRGLTALPGAEPAVTIAGWQICPAQVSRASGHTASLAVAHGPRAPSAE